MNEVYIYKPNPDKEELKDITEQVEAFEIPVVNHLKERKRGRIKRQKYSIIEQKAYFEQYQDFFEFMIFGLGGVSYQYFFGEFNREKITANLKDNRRTDVSDEERKVLDDKKFHTAVSRLAIKLEEVQLVEIVKVGNTNILRALPKLLRLLGCDSKTIEIKKEKRVKSALLGAFYLETMRNSNHSLSKLIEIVKNGNMSYFSKNKNIDIINKVSAYLEEINADTNPINNLLRREQGILDSILGKAVKKEVMKTEQGYFAEVKQTSGKKDSKSFKKYALNIQNESLSALIQKNVFVPSIKMARDKKQFVITLLILNTNDNLTPYEIAKKIAVASTFLTSSICPQGLPNGYNLYFRVRILSLKDKFSEEDKKEIFKHLEQFDKSYNMIIKSVLQSIFTFKSFPDVATRLFGCFYTLA